jgi:hypothetical protein
MMWRRLLVLDIALLAAIVFGALRLRANWQEFNATHRVESIQPEAEPVRTVAAAAPTAVTPQDWTEIAVQNPFSFDRSDIAVVASKETRPLEPKPVLFGTMSIGNEKIAMLAPGQSGSRATRPLKVGESLDSWQVVSIDSKSVVVAAANGVRQTILMNDPTAQVPRSMERTGNVAAAPAVNVVNPSPAQTPSSTAGSPAPSAPAAQPATPAQAEEFLDTPFGRVRRTKP